MANFKRKKRRNATACGLCQPHKRARKSGQAKHRGGFMRRRTHKEGYAEDIL